MKRNFFSATGAAIWAALFMMTAFFAQNLSADWTVDMKSGSILPDGAFLEGMYIDGISQQGALKIYVTTDEKALSALNLKIKGDSNLVVDCDANDNLLGLTWEGFSDEIKEEFSALKMGTGYTVGLSRKNNTDAAVEANASQRLVATIVYKIVDAEEGNVLAFPSVEAKSITPVGGGTYATKTTLNAPTALTLVQGFNFATIAAANTNEDTALTISAGDTNLFECTAWNGTALVPTEAARFTTASVADATQGSATVGADGAIVFTPAQDFNGDATVNYTAASTDPAITATVNGTITVHVAPVDDAPVLALTSAQISFKEGAALNDAGNTLAVSFTATDVDGDVLSNNAKLVLTNGTETIDMAVVLTPDTPRNGVTTYAIDLANQAQLTQVLAYEFVQHPATELALTGTLTVTDGGENAYQVELGGISANVVDVDRNPVIDSFIVSGEGYFVEKADGSIEVKTDTVLSYDVTAHDDDQEDEVTTSVVFSTGSAAPALTKGTTFTTKASATSFGASVETAEKTIAVINSQPVLADGNAGRIFIRRGGDNFTGSCSFRVTDADGWQDVKIMNGDVQIPGEGEFYAATGNLGEISTGLMNINKTQVTVDGKDNEAIVTVTFTVPESERVSDIDRQCIFSVQTYNTDAAVAASSAYTITVDFKENPVPVVTPESGRVEIAEVDTEGNPVAFTVSATATDTDVYPAGVGSWKIEVPTGWTAEAVSGDSGTVADGTWTGAASWKVTNNGYDTVVKLDTEDYRPATRDFAVKLIAVDAETLGEGSAEVAVAVSDNDRAPLGPQASLKAIDGGINGELPVHGSKLSAGGIYDNQRDPDGDEPSSDITWKYSTDKGETWLDTTGSDVYEDPEAIFGKGYNSDYTDASVIRKGNLIRAFIRTVTHPYGPNGAAVYSEEVVKVDFSICNTAPAFTELGDQKTTDAETALEYTLATTEDADGATVDFLAKDVDEDDGVDTLTYAVSEIDEKIGTVSIEGTKLTFVPAKDYNNQDATDLPSVTITVKDESDEGATNTATVLLKVTAVNDAPAIAAEDQYVLPDERGIEQAATLKVAMGGADDEDAQELSDAQIVTITDDDTIIDGTPTIAYAGKEVTLTYTIKADAELGKSATIAIKAQDNGQTDGADDFQWSAEANITIFVGASPWYPIISFECADPTAHADGHTFRLVSGDENYDLTVRGDRRQLLPADYVASGVPGFVDDTQVSATILVWTMNEGTTEEVCVTKDITVSAYGLPGVASSATAQVTADENGWVKLPAISVPMAQKYLIEVRDADGNVVQAIGPVDFQPEASGMILPNIPEMELQIAAAGDYTLSVQGINPNGEGTQTDVLTITVPSDNEAELAWTNAPAFAPANGKVLTSGTVKLSWPIATNAESYEVRVLGPDGTLCAQVSDINGTSTTVELPIDGTPKNYTWSVIAKAGNKSITSAEQNFTLAATTDTVIITEIAKADDANIKLVTDGVPSDDLDILIDYDYFSVPGLFWKDCYQVKPVKAADGTLTLPIDGITVTEGDFVLIRVWVNGARTGETISYQIQ